MIFLNYISIESTSHLRSEGEQFIFKNNSVAGLTGVGEYIVSNATNISEVWDITDKYNITSKINSSSSAFSFKANMGEERTYIALDEGDFYVPTIESPALLSNSNLKRSIFLNKI